MTLGEMTLDVLDCGRFHVDAGAAFGLIPRTLWRKVVSEDASNRIPLALNCLLVRTPQATVVVDTGVGDKLNEKSRSNFGYEGRDGILVAALAARGVAPEDVDFVVNTHLHFDHCGGNTVLRDGKAVPLFPKARYVVHEREWKDAMSPNERTRATYLKENFLPVAEARQFEWIAARTRLADGIEVLPTRGHTAGHVSVLLVAGGQPIFFAGDMVQYTVHLERLPWVSAFDHEPMESIETKRWVLDRAEKEGWVVIFEHDPNHTFTAFDRTDRVFKSWTPPPA